MAYWMLYTREQGAWAPQFGDHDKECVQDERVDTYLKRWKDDDLRYSAKDIKIVKFPRVPSQAQVMAKAKEL